MALGHFRTWGIGVRHLCRRLDGCRLLAPARLVLDELSLDLLPPAPLSRRRAVCDRPCQGLPEGYERVDERDVAGKGIVGATGQGRGRSDGATRLFGECQKRICERVVPSCLQGDSEISRPGDIRIRARLRDASESEARLRLGQSCEPFPETENRFAFQPEWLGQARGSSAIIAGAGQQRCDIGQRPRHRLIALHGQHVEEPYQGGSSGDPSTVTPQNTVRRSPCRDPGRDQDLGIRGEGGDLEGEFRTGRDPRADPVQGRRAGGAEASVRAGDVPPRDRSAGQAGSKRTPSASSSQRATPTRSEPRRGTEHQAWARQSTSRSARRRARRPSTCTSRSMQEPSPRTAQRQIADIAGSRRPGKATASARTLRAIWIAAAESPRQAADQSVDGRGCAAFRAADRRHCAAISSASGARTRHQDSGSERLAASVVPERWASGSRASVIETDLESAPARRRTVRDRWRARWTHQVAAAT